MKCEVLNISTEVANKYPTIKPLIDEDLITAIDFGYTVELSSSWLVDLTTDQQTEFDALSNELNKK